MDKNHDKFL